jgi:hypothetical protein
MPWNFKVERDKSPEYFNKALITRMKHGVHTIQDQTHKSIYTFASAQLVCVYYRYSSSLSRSRRGGYKVIIDCNKAKDSKVAQ